MRIYFSGAHSSGKSTLCRYVSEKYKLPILTESARAILSEKELNVDSLRHDLNVVDDYQTSIFNRQIEEEQKLLSFVSDRSLLDCLAYSAQHSRCLVNLINSPETGDYVTSLKSPNNVIFYVRPSKATLKSDGVRETINWDGIVAIDSFLKFMLEMWGIKYFQINMDNMQERCNLVSNIIDIHNS